MIIKMLSDNKTILFAKEELEKYLFLLDKKIPDSFIVELGLADKTDDEIDTVEVNIGKNGGTLKGSNPRSVLYAVYQYVEKLGVRWVRHGIDGEYIPKDVCVSETEVSFTKTAKNKHRGVCDEGAISIELMLQNIDWAAKMGFNEYFIQFFSPKGFFDRWYNHQRNPLRTDKRVLTIEEAAEYHSRMAYEINKRGMIYQAVGHGWNTESYGVELMSVDDEIPEELKEAIAMINGKREPLNTIGNAQLCYSNPKVQKKLASAVADYAENNKEVDAIYFFLADGFNSHCECEECQKAIPTDFYVQILNEIDKELEKRNLPTKIVALAYLELLWAPEIEKIKNPGRFTITFCPIGRNYKTSYEDLKELPEIPVYVRNKIEIPSDVALNVSHLKKWQEKCSFSSAFSFEYFNWNAQRYGDMGSLNVANVVYRDVKVLKDVGLSGMITCESQRSFMPLGLNTYVMIKALWDDAITFEEIVDKYFAGAFGDLSDVFKTHFKALSELSKEDNSRERAIKLKDIVIKMLNFIEENEEEINRGNHCHIQSVFYAKYHCELYCKMAEADIEYYEKGQEESLDKWKKIVDFVRETEPSVFNVLDLYHFFSYLVGKHHPGFKSLKAYIESEKKRNEYNFV